MLSLYFLLTTLRFAFAADFYDEAYTPARRPRPAYREFKTKFGQDVLKPNPDLREFMLGRPLDDSQRAWPVPLVLSDAEYQTIRDGVVQRASVFKEFMFDLLADEPRIKRELTELEWATVEAAFRADGHSLGFLRRVYRGIPKSKIRFLYGPDLIRTDEGSWVVLEDNIGSVGGLGDTDYLRIQYLDKAGLKMPETYVLVEMVRSFLADLGGTVANSVALLETSTPNISAMDLEAARLIRVFKAGGVRTEEFSDLMHMNLERAGPEKFAFVLAPFARVDIGFLLGMIESFVKDERELFTTPLIEAIDSKAILPLMDRLARFYLNEDLVLKSPPTTPLLQIDDLMQAIERWGLEIVVKKADGSQGHDVHILSTMADGQVSELAKQMNEARLAHLLSTGLEIPSYVVQPRIEPSRLTLGDGPRGIQARIDLRPLAYVGPSRIIPAVQPWGRATTEFGDPRLNVSQGAMQLVVLTPCPKMLEF